MAVNNYQTMELRASAITAATDGVDGTVVLPPHINSGWLRVQKTAETGTDAIITVRLQCLINSGDWVDVPYDSIHTTQTLSVSTDKTTSVVKKGNAVHENTADATFTVLARYKELPSNTVRTVWVHGGAHESTWEADFTFAHNN